MTRRTLLSLGSVNADFQVRVEQPPGSAETLLARDQLRQSGGKAANVAVLARRFDHRAVLLARVGDDDLAEQALAPLREAGIDVDQVDRARAQPTGLSMIMVPPDGKKHIVLATNANDCWDEQAARAVVEAITHARTPALLVADYEIPAWVVRQAIVAARRSAIPVVLDPSFPARVEHELLAGLTAVTPNADEAEALTGEEADSVEGAARAARKLRDAGVQIVCVKLADGGCVLSTGDEQLLIPASEVEVVDSTGAGDAFTGVLAAELLAAREPLEAAVRAVAASSLAVSGYGSQPAYPSRSSVESHAARLLPHVRRLHV